MSFDAIARKFLPPSPITLGRPESEQKTTITPWWCDDCQIAVDGRDVTFQERRDERAGGCGCIVYPSCAACENGGWEAYGLGHHDPHMRPCQECGNPFGRECP